MAFYTAALSSPVQTTLEIDYIGQKYGVFRDENETTEDFKARLLSALVFPNSYSDLGYSYGLSRSLNCYPRIIGYMHLDDDYCINYDGHSLKIYDSIGGAIVLVKDTLDNFTIGDLVEFFNDNGIGTIYCENPEYLNKNIAFLNNVLNFESKRDMLAFEGMSYLSDKYIDFTSIRSDSEHVRFDVGSPELITKIGEYCWQAPNKLFTYDSNRAIPIVISYSRRWEYIPLIYVPVKVIGLTKLLDASADSNKVSLIQEEENFPTIYNEMNKEYKEILWNGLMQNSSLWKANTISPTSVLGTYYGN
jgi:hypothetical protein